MEKSQNIGTKSAIMPTLKGYTFSSTNSKLRRECTFSLYILHFFYFDPYILFLPLLVLKPINA